MMTEKFTPGPWYPGHLGNENHPCECTSILSEIYPGAIATVHFDNGKRIGEGGNACPPRSEAVHNIHLIAATPEMYEALKDTLWCLEIYYKKANPEWGGIASDFSVIGKARAALAKAKGEAM